MLSFGLKSSRVRHVFRKLHLDFRGQCGLPGDMDNATSHDPDLIDLVVQLCTRIGMIMEDTSPVALNASPEGLAQRTFEIAREARRLAVIAEAAQRLIGE